MNMQEKLDQILGKEISQASNEEIYDALLTIVQEMASKKERTDSKKKLYYISAEFLIGKLLSNNMINLGIYKEVKEILEKHGKNLSENRNRLWEMAGLEDLQRASWIPLQRLDLREMVSD